MTWITELLMSNANLETVLRVLEVISIMGGGLAIVWRMSGMATRFEMIGTQQAAEIKELKLAVEAMVTRSLRVDRLEERQLQEGKRLDELTSRVNRYIEGNGGGR